MTKSEAALRFRWRAKWRFVAMYWVVQALAVHLIVCGLFTTEVPRLDRLIDFVASPELLILDTIYAVVMAAAQAVLLLPVRRPRLSVHAPAVRFVHGAVGGFVIAGVFWLALWPLLLLADIVGLGASAGVLTESHASWILPLAVWIIATIGLCAAGRDGLPVQLSVVLCGLAAALLIAGLAGLVLSIPRLVLNDAELNHLVMGAMCGVFFLAWGVGTPILWRFVRRGEPEDVLAKVASRLLMGTVVEAACAIPLDVMVRRKTNCYCEEGTFWALSACWAVGLFACGPVIFLVPLSRRRKRWYAGKCDVCGYDMAGCMGAERCPECGAGWKAAAASGA